MNQSIGNKCRTSDHKMDKSVLNTELKLRHSLAHHMTPWTSKYFNQSHTLNSDSSVFRLPQHRGRGGSREQWAEGPIPGAAVDPEEHSCIWRQPWQCDHNRHVCRRRQRSLSLPLSQILWFVCISYSNSPNLSYFTLLQ